MFKNNARSILHVKKLIMPTNFDAVLRYHTIDQCLQNRFRSWTWEDLAEKCTDAIVDATGNRKKDSISKRTIQNDIKIMRSNHLGYEAPISVRNGEYYYEDPNYSIRNATVTQADIRNMAAAIKMFKTYKGLEFFGEVESLINKLEKQVHVKTYTEVQKIICFEQVPPSCGQEKVNPLMQAILSREAIKLSYKKYNKEEVKSYILHPYFLKEYRNRWYILGWFEEGSYIKTFALDRIIGFEPANDVDYIDRHKPDPEAYFKNTIGITLNNSGPETILLKFTGSQLPYIRSQPLHESQEIVQETSDSLTIQLKLTLNYELESKILSYADEVEVVQPIVLRDKINARIGAAFSKIKSQKMPSR